MIIGAVQREAVRQWAESRLPDWSLSLLRRRAAVHRLISRLPAIDGPMESCSAIRLRQVDVGFFAIQIARISQRVYLLRPQARHWLTASCSAPKIDLPQCLTGLPRCK